MGESKRATADFIRGSGMGGKKVGGNVVFEFEESTTMPHPHSFQVQ
jgi:hypothetical protein